MSDEKTRDTEPEATSLIEKKRLYSESLSGNQQKTAEQKTFRLTVPSIEHMKTLVKTKANPVKMKLELQHLKVLAMGDC